MDRKALSVVLACTLSMPHLSLAQDAQVPAFKASAEAITVDVVVLELAP